MARVTSKFSVVGGGGGTMVAETPSGSINGTNTAFTLAHTPTTGSFSLFRDGLLVSDYSRSGTSITMTTAPKAGQDLVAVYSY